jgi:uncharacterized protein (TIGR02453 family)
LPADARFSTELFAFLRDLARNNRRDWFLAHKQRYEDAVRLPAQRLIVDLGPGLKKVSPHFVADPRPVGGSLFRIYRDTRFSQDKTPYKTHVGIHFPHARRGDVHAPGFYLHLEPGEVFLAAGIWHPDASSLQTIRRSIVANPAGWKRARDERRFRASFELDGESLSRPPRGFDPEHPLIEDLKRKDFVATTAMTEREAVRSDFVDRVAEACSGAGPFVRWLCRTLELPF